MDYKHYKHERKHDELLIELVEELATNEDGLKIVEKVFKVKDLCPPVWAYHRKPFDVELTFENLSIIVESKVDSNENWDNVWQTEETVKKCSELGYLREEKHYRFITYGTSEFYTKNCKAGPASSEFQHIKLNKMIHFVSAAIKVTHECEKRQKWQEWLDQMKIEKKKRKHAVKLLQPFAKFRKQYLKIQNENDFPRNRLLFCAPELAFPVMSKLLKEWKKSEYAKQFGKLELYPAGRLSPSINDSILNFHEMWYSQGGVKNLGHVFSTGGEVDLYLEINEDFNLNLKSWSKTEDKKLEDSVKRDIWSRLKDVPWPKFAKHQCCSYPQGDEVEVLYEVDFGFLDNLSDLKQVTTNLGQTVSAIVQGLSKSNA